MAPPISSNSIAPIARSRKPSPGPHTIVAEESLNARFLKPVRKLGKNDRRSVEEPPVSGVLTLHGVGHQHNESIHAI
jgi:hypothetical protein